MSWQIRGFSVVTSLMMLVGCGGGGGGGGNAPLNPPTSGSVPYTPGVYQPSSGLAAQCVAPRSGTDPRSGRAWPDRQGSVASENNYLRSWTNELYLWYREVPDLNPSNTNDTLNYFDLLRTSATTPSGQDKDKFHFTYDTDDWIALSESGVEAGYGAEWFLASTTPPRRIIVAYTEPGSPAASGNLTRGAEVLRIDGIDAVNGNTQAIVDTLIAGLFPEGINEAHTFEIRELNGSPRTVTLTSAEVTSAPVPVFKTIGSVGYLLFNDHIATSEPALINAVNTLRNQSITDLVLDIRYNGGGFLDIASELAYMIGGTRTAGRTFERLVFNDKHPSTNPVTGQALTPTPFHTTNQFIAPTGQALPTLDLPRVYVLTGPNTCSASEAIINSLRGVNVEVYQIGSTTCGKPYGFYPQDNCGTTYFSIQFQGNNELGFGNYPDGFSPNNTSGQAGERIPGCSVADDFTHPLGDPAEARLAAALAFRAGNNQASACPAATGFAPGVQTKPGQPLYIADGVMLKSPARENRILRDM
ncbi:MAG: S41 family peptidase [Steroidobacter sp.]